MNKKNPDSMSRGIVLPLLMALALYLAPHTAQANEFVLLYANDNLGEIDPCG